MKKYIFLSMLILYFLSQPSFAESDNNIKIKDFLSWDLVRQVTYLQGYDDAGGFSGSYSYKESPCFGLRENILFTDVIKTLKKSISGNNKWQENSILGAHLPEYFEAVCYEIREKSDK